MRRSSAPGSRAPKTAEPITSTSAPASTSSHAFSAPTPPSTSIKHAKPRRSMRERASRTFSIERAINYCPEKPGFTLMTSTVSQSSMTSWSISTGVCGQIAKPAFAPMSRRCVSSRCAWDVASK